MAGLRPAVSSRRVHVQPPPSNPHEPTSAMSSWRACLWPTVSSHPPGAHGGHDGRHELTVAYDVHRELTVDNGGHRELTVAAVSSHMLQVPS